jgi:hypothetical protein
MAGLKLNKVEEAFSSASIQLMPFYVTGVIGEINE